MENSIFDYNISELELRVLDIKDRKDDYILERSKLMKLYHIYKLMMLRSNETEANLILYEIFFTYTLPNLRSLL